jgi:hypothetical protein
MMKRIALVSTIVIAVAAPAAVRACGACVEDKVAATYDYVVIHKAIAKHRQVVFVAVDGPIDADKMGARIAAAAAQVRGIVAGTLRTSVAPPAFSFALDAAQTPETALAAFRKAVGDPGVRLTVVRIMRNGALIEP